MTSVIFHDTCCVCDDLICGCVLPGYSDGVFHH